MQVHNAVGLSDDTVMLYFENKKRSGGGDIDNTYTIGDCLIVQFSEPTGKILQEVHLSIDEVKLCIDLKLPHI